MAPADALTGASFPKLLVSFGIGIAIGGAAVLPAVGTGLVGSGLDDPGPVGNVLLLGVLLLVVVTLGLFSLFQLFWLVDR